MNASKTSEPTHIRYCEHGWDEHEQMQLQRLASLSFAEKLVWLQDAHRLVKQLGAARRPRTDDPSSST